MDEIERHNWDIIQGLNQRGGRMLSVVDLIEAKTLDIELAGYLCYRMFKGASLLTAAKPGGAGKTTVMAALLGFVAPGVILRDVSDSILYGTERLPDNVQQYVIAHEIGSGYYYGYIWGDEVTRYLSLINKYVSIASNLHADTIEELRDAMLSMTGLTPALLARIDLIVFIHIFGASVFSRLERKVAEVWQSDGKTHHCVFRLHDCGAFKCEDHLKKDEFKGVENFKSFLSTALKNGVRDYLKLRSRYLEFLKNQNL